MADGIDDETFAVRTRAEAFGRLFSDGVGHTSRARWTNETFAKKLGCGTGTVSGWRKGNVISDTFRPLVLEVFFRNPADRSRYAREYEIVSGAADRSGDDDIYTPVFSRKELWDALLAPIQSNVERLITEAGDADGIPGLRMEHLSSARVEKQFHINPPEWFVDWAREKGPSGHARYDVFAPCDLTGSSDLEELRRLDPDDAIPDMIARYANDYAKEVKAQHDKASGFPPYNKAKLGLLGVSQIVPGGAPERAYVCISGYRTDYFTHRVMREVTRELRRAQPGLFTELDTRFLTSAADIAYFTTSIGLNAITVTRDGVAREFQMVVTSPQIANPNQRDRWHVSANEGVNADDIDGGTGKIDFGGCVRRALVEELGVDSRLGRNGEFIDPIEDILFLECSIEMTNFEPFLSCLVYLDMTSEELAKAYRLNARDRRRESKKLVHRPFTVPGLINVLFENERDTSRFTSYSLQILDLIVEKNIPLIYRPES